MAYDFRLPDLGEGIAEGEVIKWVVSEGEKVDEHQPIVEIETDKAVVQVPSPKSGTMLKINFKAGETVHVGDVLCTIGEAGEKIAAKEVKLIPKAAPIKKVSTTVIGQLEEAPEEEVKTALTPPKKVAEPMIAALPAVRKLAQEMGVDITKVQGTGGRITEDDVRRAAGKSVKETPKAATVTFERFGRVLRIPLKGIRKTIAENMTKSLSTAAHVTHMDYADVTKLSDFREKEKAAAEEKGVHLTYLPFIIKACTLALKEFPYVNSSLDDETNDIVIKQYYNIGVAVDTEHGLMDPVIKNANEKTIIELGRDIWRLAELCRTREIELKDLQGGTFTVTNIGSIGGIWATPVINWPECAILALGKICDKAIPINGKIEIRKMLPMSLSFDHRIIDGAMAAKFVTEIKRHLEDPDALLMGF